MTVLIVKFEAEKEQSRVHHAQLRPVVTKAEEAIASDCLLKVAPLDFFRLSFKPRLTFLIEDFFLCECFVFICELGRKVILLKIFHECIEIACIEHILSICRDLTRPAPL